MTSWCLSGEWVYNRTAFSRLPPVHNAELEPKPHTILFDSHGEFLTGEAMRWCARYSINLLLPGGPGRIITMVESEQHCNFIIYKDKSKVPAKYYERLGLKKPA